MKTIVVSVVLLFLSFNILRSQECFVFESLDKAIIQFWLSAKNGSPTLDADFNQVKDKWQFHNAIILEKSRDLPMSDDFFSIQDDRLRTIESYLSRKKTEPLVQEAFLFLMEFSDVRQCYCKSDYFLDELIQTQNSYAAIHEIIHDELLGLYEWNEFVWHIDRFKEQVQSLESRIANDNSVADSIYYLDNLGKVKECLSNLEAELEKAGREDVEISCLQINSAIEDIFKEFVSLKSI